MKKPFRFGLYPIVSRLKRNDGLLIGFLLLSAVILFLASRILGVAGKYVEVSVDGVPYGVYSLLDNQEFTIGNLHTGELTFRIGDGSVSVTQSTCPDLICVHHRDISKTGESIICLPNRIAIKILGDNQNAPDSITR